MRMYKYCLTEADCSDLMGSENIETGIYKITVKVGNGTKDVDVYCDQQTTNGGWLVCMFQCLAFSCLNFIQYFINNSLQLKVKR